LGYVGSVPVPRKQRFSVLAEIHERLAAEAHRRHVGVSELAEQLIAGGLDRLEGRPRQD
jgi:hypothetical protein